MEANELSKEIGKIRSLIDRLEKHHTVLEAIQNERMYLTEGVARKLATPNEVFEILNTIGRNAFVCIGTANGANLELPKVKRKNPLTNRMKSYDDFETFGKAVGYDGEIGALVNITSYNFRFYPLEDINKQYSAYKQSANKIRADYGIDPIKDKGDADYRDKMEYGSGINVYGGGNKDKEGNFYVAFNSFNVKPKGMTYIVDSEGHITQELTKDQVRPFLKKNLDPYASISGVRALREIGKTEEEIKAYVEALQNLKFQYKNFVGDKILWIAATVNGQKLIYINSNFTLAVNDININKDDFLQKANERYEIDMSTIGT